MCLFTRTLDIPTNCLVTDAFKGGFNYASSRQMFHWVTKYLLDPDIEGLEEEYEAALASIEDQDLLDRVDGYRTRLIADFMNAINKEAYISNSKSGITKLGDHMIGWFKVPKQVTHPS
jgi:hypothetical protein